MRLLEFVRQRVTQRSQHVVRGRYTYPPWQPVPTAPSNPMQMKEPYSMFYRRPTRGRQEPYAGCVTCGPVAAVPISAYVPGWQRSGNFGTVERIPPSQGRREPGMETLNAPGQVGVLQSGVRGTEPTFPETRPIHGVRPSQRFIAEHNEPYSFHQRAPPPVTAPNAWTRHEAYDFAYRGAIGAPRHQYRMPLSQNECYDFTY